MSRSDLVDIKMFVHVETERAILASATGEKSDAVWLPKSQIEREHLYASTSKITMPEWLAIEKELA